MKNFKLFIFDWSGTISDDRLPVYESNKRLCDDFGLAIPSYQQWLDESTMSAKEYFHRKGNNLTPDQIFDKYRQHFNTINAEGLVPVLYADAPAALATLQQKGKRMAVISAHPHANLLEEAKFYKVDQYFEDMLGSVKDKTTAMQRLCISMDVTPSQAVYVTDSVHDIIAAKAAGVKTIAVSTGYHRHDMLRDEKPDYLFHNLSEIAAATK